MTTTTAMQTRAHVEEANTVPVGDENTSGTLAITRCWSITHHAHGSESSIRADAVHITRLAELSCTELHGAYNAWIIISSTTMRAQPDAGVTRRTQRLPQSLTSSVPSGSEHMPPIL